jgi:hypothetical protein
MRRGLLFGVILSLVVAGPVLAAPPPNDTLAGAIEVNVGTTVTQNTTEATVDALEQSLGDFCGPPALGGPVWFEFTPTEDATIAFDVTESDFSAGVFVYAGTPTPEGVLACGPGSVVVDVLAGETYNIMAIGDGLSPEITGTLVFKVIVAEPPPELSLTVDKGFVDRQGVVRIVGTITCSSESGDPIFVDLFGDISQRIGRLVVRGFFSNFIEIPCDGSTTEWEAFAIGENGVFAGGKAATVAIGFGCTDSCSEAFTEATIQLRRSGK